jgi:predicted nucleic acid-binding protein
LIAATSRAHGARYLLTTDRALARLDGVKLVNASR